MKCPHCEYEYRTEEWNSELGEFVEGTGNEDFFKLPIKLARNEDTYERETKALYGCPACNKTFIGE